MTPISPAGGVTRPAPPPAVPPCQHVLPLYTAHLCVTCRDLRDDYRTALRPPPERKAPRG